MKNGYKRATTKSIAKAAGVSEVTLFRHFDSKESLLKAAMEAYGSPLLARLIESRLTGEYEEDMHMIGRFFMNAALERAGVLCFAVSEARHFPILRTLFAQMPGQMWRLLAEYLQKQMDKGVVRELHPEAAAQAFFGMFFAYAVSREAFRMGPRPEIPHQQAADQIVDIFVKGTLNQ